MIYDMRIYDLVPGGVPGYMDAVRELALPIRQKYGIKLAGWYYPEAGPINRVVHIWAYRDWAHLGEGKEQTRADPQWGKEYIPRVRPLIVRQQSHVCLAADFFPGPA